MFSVLSLDKNNDEDKYHTDGFKKVIEDFLPTLKQSEKTTTVTVDYAIAQKWTGDFYGLLKELKIPYNYRWVTMRANGLHSSSDWTGEDTSVVIVATTDVDNVLAKHLTTESGI